MGAILIAGKVLGTYKRSRDIVLASVALRQPELVKVKSSSAAQLPEVTTLDIDNSQVRLLCVLLACGMCANLSHQMLNTLRRRIENVERNICNATSYNFDAQTPSALDVVVQFGRLWALPKEDVRLAWKIVSDAYVLLPIS